MTESSTNKGNPIRRWFAGRLEHRIDRLWLVVVMLSTSLVYAQDELPDIVTDERTGVKIVFYDFTKHEPKSEHQWGHELITVEVVPAKRQNRSRYKAHAQNAMKQYPAELIKKHLRTIYIMEELKVIIGSAGTGESQGVYDWEHGAIYLMTGGVKYNSENNIEEIFHHEFSSFLLRDSAHLFPKKEWLALNPSNFRYELNLEEVTDSNGELVAPESSEFYHQRCLSQFYASTSWENDVNMFAMQLFNLRTVHGGWGPEVIPVDEYPCLQKKLDLLAAFYRRIHPLFTAEYFANEN